jgi:formamidopyrimidine-DNA glycosylase
MPELPEVEIIRQGLAPLVTNARIERVVLNRANLRFPFPPQFGERLQGQRIIQVGRRAKYLLFRLSSGQTLLAHLGMTGNFRFFRPDPDPRAINFGFEKHDHVIFELCATQAPEPFLVYSDPRRFGFMDLIGEESDCAFLRRLGPEPLGNELSAIGLNESFKRRKAPVKSVLLDQSVVAGLGNIYVCEALHRAGIDPITPASDLAGDGSAPSAVMDVLVREIRAVLTDALRAGGSTLQDYRNVEGQGGYFQHSFAVYDREGEACTRDGCAGHISRIVQSGRSSFYCPDCQSPEPRVGPLDKSC